MTDFRFSDIGSKSSFLPKIKVIGVGGAGGNAVVNMMNHGLSDVEFWVANTDLQALLESPCENKIQLGSEATNGLGAGADPDIGARAALESKDQILEYLSDAHVIFIAAGMGGGTGTGAAPVIAKMLKERGILTIGIVTKPFTFEGSARLKAAETGIVNMENSVDTLVIVMNQHLFRIANESTSFAQAFRDADSILCDGVKCISDLFTKPGLINLDLADVRSIISDRGMAMIGMGEASGPDKAERSVELAITNPLLENSLFAKAEALLLNISGSPSMTLFEVEKIADTIRDKIFLTNPDAKFIVGTTLDPSIDDSLRVSVIATGVSKKDSLTSQITDKESDTKEEKNQVDYSSKFENIENKTDNFDNEINISESDLLSDVDIKIEEDVNIENTKEEDKFSIFSSTVSDADNIIHSNHQAKKESLIQNKDKIKDFKSDFSSKVDYSPNSFFSAPIPEKVRESNESGLRYNSEPISDFNLEEDIGLQSFEYTSEKNDSSVGQEDSHDSNKYNVEDKNYIKEEESFIDYDIGGNIKLKDETKDNNKESESESIDIEREGGFLEHFLGSVAKKFNKQKMEYKRRHLQQDSDHLKKK